MAYLHRLPLPWQMKAYKGRVCESYDCLTKWTLLVLRAFRFQNVNWSLAIHAKVCTYAWKSWTQHSAFEPELTKALEKK